jgi:hypothetical protein
MMTEQETFDKVARHLLKQGKQAKACFGLLSAEPRCAYRTPEGLTCAAGCLIPDELYDPQFEGSAFSALAANEPRLAALAPVFLVAYLQTIHDAHEPTTWKGKLAELAEWKHLNADVLNEFA